VLIQWLFRVTAPGDEMAAVDPDLKSLETPANQVLTDAPQSHAVSDSRHASLHPTETGFQKLPSNSAAA
jgi:hypothetical protein